MDDDAAYFAKRAAAEWESAKTAPDIATAAVHEKLAKKYEALAKDSPFAAQKPNIE